MALHNCDEVAVAGFGYDMNTPHAPLHYYETVKMSAIKEVSFSQWERTERNVCKGAFSEL